MAKYFYFLCSLLISVSLIILGFTSCSGSNTIATSSSRRTSTSRNTSSSSSDDKEKDDGEPCRDSDSCEDTCEKIYDVYDDIQECEDEGRDKVGRLDKVYKHLKSGDYSELEDISEEDNDVDMDDFEDYLEIGVSGWIKGFEVKTATGGGWWASGSSRTDGLTNTLKWIIDKTNVAEVLQDRDNDGLDVLEELLKALPQGGTGKNKESYIGRAAVACSATTDKFKWFSTNTGNTLTYCDDATTGTDTINFNSSSNKDLYNALSVIYFKTGNNIFSHSVEEKDNGGTVVFDMAYQLLDKVCSKVRGDTDQIVCRRAMFCWTHFLSSTEDDEYDDEYDELVTQYKQYLERSGSDHSDYDECSKVHFGSI